MLHNVRKFPALVSQFFHMRTELFLQRFGELLGVEAYWLRHEWQARGSTHAHFFLWLKDAPNLEFLDAFICGLVNFSVFPTVDWLWAMP